MKFDDTIKDMTNRKLLIPPVLGVVLTGLCLSCAARTALNVPAPVLPPREKPSAAVSYDRIEAGDVNHVTLFFLLEVQNPRNSTARLAIQDWKVTVNGVNPGEGAVLGFGEDTIRLDAGASRQIPLGLTLDLRTLPLEHEDFDEYQVTVDLNLGFVFDPRDTAEVTLIAQAAFPRIRKPDFFITTIAIMRAELINTRLKVKLRVDNPNGFPVELSSFSYELYGGDRFWADGKETEAFLIPARGSAETELSLVMNFINMRRELLDQIISMRQVKYRFAGEAAISTNLEFLPHFMVDFDRSGDSAVLD
jgi:LEA14-like dessication related protein